MFNTRVYAADIYNMNSIKVSELEKVAQNKLGTTLLHDIFIVILILNLLAVASLPLKV